MLPAFVSAQFLPVWKYILAHIASKLISDNILEKRLIRVTVIKSWEGGDGDGGAGLRDFPGQDTIEIVHVGAGKIINPSGMKSRKVGPSLFQIICQLLEVRVSTICRIEVSREIIHRFPIKPPKNRSKDKTMMRGALRHGVPPPKPLTSQITRKCPQSHLGQDSGIVVPSGFILPTFPSQGFPSKGHVLRFEFRRVLCTQSTRLQTRQACT